MERTPKKRGPQFANGEGPKIRRSITVDPALWADAQKTALSRHESLSGVIGRSLANYVTRYKDGVDSAGSE